GEISAASQEQTSGIEQINQSVAQMDQATQQNAALVEESAAASESMREQAARLAEAVSVFKLQATMAPKQALASRPAAKSIMAPTPVPAAALENARPLAPATRVAVKAPARAQPQRVTTQDEEWAEF